jgi:hypothetical protein
MQSGAQAQVQHTPHYVRLVRAGLSYMFESGSSLRSRASRLVVPAFPAEPDIYLRSRAAMSRHRRLSLCSLPVPKQFVESLRSLISIAQSPIGGTWQPAHG